MHPRLASAAVLAALLTTPTAGARADEVSILEGKGIVELYCADCHATGPTGDSPHPRAPRFRELHERYDVEWLSEALVEGIVTHPDMPEFEFDPEQAAAVIDFLKSLEPNAE